MQKKRLSLNKKKAPNAKPEIQNLNGVISLGSVAQSVLKYDFRDSVMGPLNFWRALQEAKWGHSVILIISP